MLKTFFELINPPNLTEKTELKILKILCLKRLSYTSPNLRLTHTPGDKDCSGELRGQLLNKIENHCRFCDLPILFCMYHITIKLVSSSLYHFSDCHVSGTAMHLKLQHCNRQNGSRAIASSWKEDELEKEQEPPD